MTESVFLKHCFKMSFTLSSIFKNFVNASSALKYFSPFLMLECSVNNRETMLTGKLI